MRFDLPDPDVCTEEPRGCCVALLKQHSSFKILHARTRALVYTGVIGSPTGREIPSDTQKTSLPHKRTRACMRKYHSTKCAKTNACTYGKVYSVCTSMICGHQTLYHRTFFLQTYRVHSSTFISWLALYVWHCSSQITNQGLARHTYLWIQLRSAGSIDEISPSRSARFVRLRTIAGGWGR